MLHLIPCPVCAGNKSHTTRSYGSYKVYIHITSLRLKCKTCGHIQNYKIIEGGV